MKTTVQHTQEQQQYPLTKKRMRWLHSRYASWTLAFISFAESVFAPIIIDPFLVALIFAKREFWVKYTVISIVASIVGGICAYILGALFFDTIGQKLIDMYHLGSQFSSISDSLNENGFVFVLIGAFTPIPYKIVALASGLLHVNFITFMVASIIGRVLRLGLVGLAAYMVGPRALPVMQRNLHLLATIVGFVLFAYIVIQLL